MKKSIILFALVAILAGCKKSGGSIKVTCTKYTNCNTSSGAIINASGATVRLVNINGSILETKNTSSNGEVIFEDVESGDYDIVGFVEISACTAQDQERINVSDGATKNVALFLD